jgi:hypothetical protein
VLVVVWIPVSSVACHPAYLSYFNELVPSEPEKVLVDSDLDWGQDTVRLARRLRELGVDRVSFLTMNLQSDQLRVWPGLPPVTPVDPYEPTERWTAVSPTFWKVTQFGLFYRYPSIKPWFEDLRPTERVGSILLYHVPANAIRPGH